MTSIMPYIDTDKTYWERDRQELHKNAMSYFREIFEATPHETIAVQLYDHLPANSITIQIRQTGHVGHCWRSKDEVISDILLWTLSHRCVCVGWPIRTYLQQLCAGTGCSQEDLSGVMNDWDEWREWVREICLSGTTWWWWWWWWWWWLLLLF